MTQANIGAMAYVMSSRGCLTRKPFIGRIISGTSKTTEVAQKPSETLGGSKVPGKMGRKKIQISRIGDERNRQVTFTKRKFGLMKKAYELSILCDCEIALIIFNSANKLFQYASTDMDKVLLKYTEYNEPHESRTNKDIIEALNKKEHKGCESPDPDADPYGNSMIPEEKYSRMNEEYQRVMHQNSMRHMSPYPNTGMHPGVSTGIPLHNSPFMNQSMSGHCLSPNPPPPPQVNSAPGLLQPPPVHSIGSPRPNSTGGMVDMSGSVSPAPNGYHRGSPCPSPGAMVNRQQSRQSPPSRGPPMGRQMMSNSRDGMMSPVDSRPNSAMSNPAVALTTPSIPVSNYPSPLPSSYHNEFSMNSADLSGHPTNYSPSPWMGNQQTGSLTSGIPPGGGTRGHSNNLTLPQNNSGHVSPLMVNTMNQNIQMNIKSEPISPPRDSTTPSSLHSLRPPSAGQGHLSPNHTINHTHSNNSSPITVSQHSLPLEYDGPLLKRQRVSGWPT
ncbi:hypothetical protein FSP39_008615 [Pinctada imbricata]|uniref:MADS-box domain-containing protein n=1 Tax=Pinctada imbricata TaxID=66713 RepID=A0AA88Y3M9_PINIB|nr:hypothetical protein FSP39_008615 [Pinctada imbricata]